MSDLDSREASQCNRWGGIAALLLATGYVAIIPLFSWAGAPPMTGEAWFRYLPGKATAWWVIIWLSVITDLLYLPVTWALWTTLRKAGTKLMLAAVACLNLFVVLDLAVTWTHHASILALFHKYSSASDDAHRAVYLAAAEYASSIYATPLLTFYIIVIPSMGVLLASIAMIMAGFGKPTAWTGVIVGVFGIMSLTGFFPLVVANALGATLWYFLVGARLLRLGMRSPKQTSSWRSTVRDKAATEAPATGPRSQGSEMGSTNDGCPRRLRSVLLSQSGAIDPCSVKLACNGRRALVGAG